MRNTEMQSSTNLQVQEVGTVLVPATVPSGTLKTTVPPMGPLLQVCVCVRAPPAAQSGSLAAQRSHTHKRTIVAISSPP